jgi:hypothetical protein
VPDLDADGLAYDRGAAGYEWESGAFTWDQLSEILVANDRTDVGRLVDLVFDRGVSGRIYRVTIKGSSRTVQVSGQLFKAVFNNNRLSGAPLNNSLFYIKRAP